MVRDEREPRPGQKRKHGEGDDEDAEEGSESDDIAVGRVLELVLEMEQGKFEKLLEVMGRTDDLPRVDDYTAGDRGAWLTLTLTLNPNLEEAVDSVSGMFGSGRAGSTTGAGWGRRGIALRLVWVQPVDLTPTDF